jgi:hypothetical protein
MTLENGDLADIKQAIEPFVEEILDIRETRLI